MLPLARSSYEVSFISVYRLCYYITRSQWCLQFVGRVYPGVQQIRLRSATCAECDAQWVGACGSVLDIALCLSFPFVLR